MGELQIFKDAKFGFVRTITVEGEPYFAGKDVAEILGYSNTGKALADHVDEECRAKAALNPDSPDAAELMKENLRLRKELEEAKKENLFLKKRRHSLQRKSISGLPVC